MAICTQCGRENPEEARFCMACATELGDSSPTRREERKVVSVLFCDLVGYTASAHSADPEDVRRILGEYHAGVRAVIERFGGTVEKFIGDAAVGVWGAPQAHEDDAERALRAALAILDAVAVDVRIAVNTGEVLAMVDPELDIGMGIVGDVVNTASRLQAVAPTGGILAGEGTVRMTGAAIEYEPLEPVVVKGKPDPVPIWRVISARSRMDERREGKETPFVGRGREFQLLRDVFERAVDEPGVQIVSIVGEPGIGKSRLVAEFDGWLDARGGSVLRLRGRCLAYGDGIGFWPLAEIVKQHLGLTETDSEDDARARLEAAVSGMTDSAWLRARLAPLVGLLGEGGEREEVFTAWQRFFDEVAARHPLALVFEDLHWGHPAMLAFVQYLAEWSTAVPMLIVCTARPELFEAHPHWAGGLANATTLALRPLDEKDTGRLAHALLGRMFASTEAESTLVDRCGGNPLYAEEYARLLAERSVEAVADLAMPETVQALIAARVDTLPPQRKDMLHDAAVIGKAFWAGAVAALGGRGAAQVRSELHELARKELVRRARTSTLPGDEEYTFWHDLVHQVAYQQIPRNERADKHRRTAEWIEHTSGDRLGDRAELIAHHYQQALALTLASGQGDPEPLRRAAVRASRMAADRAVGIDVEHAEQLIREGLALTSEDDPERGPMLCLLGECLFHLGQHEQARLLLEDARSAAEAAGDIQTAGAALILALQVVWVMGDSARARGLASEAVERLRREQPTDQLARALGWSGCLDMLAEDSAPARAALEEAIQVGEAVNDPLGIALALLWRGVVDAETGESDGSDDFERASRTLTELGSSFAPQGPHNAASATLMWHGPAAGKALYLEAIEYSRRIHVSAWEMQALGELPWTLFDLGEWDELLEVADRVIAWGATSGAGQPVMLAAPQKARVLALRGNIDNARDAMSGMVDRIRSVGESQVVAPAFATAALIEHLDGHPDRARGLITELGGVATSAYAPLAEICRILIAGRSVDDARTLIAGLSKIPPRTKHAVASAQAMLAEADADHQAASRLYQDAASRWRSFGCPFEVAHALAGQARGLASLDLPHEAEAPRAEAATIFERLGVSDHVWRGSLSAQTQPRSV